MIRIVTHKKRNFKYHTVFATKYIGKIFYEEKRERIRTPCERKRVEITV